MIELIDRLVKDGTAKKLIAAGLASPNLIFYRNIYLSYDVLIKTGVRRYDAVVHTAETFKISERLVYLAIKSMKPKKTKPTP